ncbi:hypothetical protein N7478_001456 [Penicillium angulare]|uniref:uncharacterized protein n=1 Tax=Penicillium angulare TaxID=116970 RepID=UPI0025424A0A|nr:uncharacterized protein N7478_001456 [Penicillium angulare]KAJ5292205.1 hypothetical protein N7478_001456 [Penicillium angulare]
MNHTRYMNVSFARDQHSSRKRSAAGSKTGHDFVEEASIVNVTESTRPLAFSLDASSKVNGEIYGNLESIETAEASETASDPLSFHILIYPLADRMFAEGLKTLAKENAKRTFQDAIKEIFHSTTPSDRDLRDMAVNLTLNHLRT